MTEGRAAQAGREQGEFPRRTVLRATAAVGLGSTLGATTGRAQDGGGNLVWEFGTGDLVTSSPTVVDGSVYIGSRDGNLYALDAASGDENWSVSLDDEVVSSPTVVDGTLFVGSTDGRVYALDPDSGAETWSFAAGVEANDGVRTSPTVADGTVFVGSDEPRIYALDAAEGTEIWSYGEFPDTGMLSSPTLVDGTLFTGGGVGDNTVYALDAESGEEVWTVGELGAIRSSPTVAGGTVFIPTYDGRLHALDAESGTEEWTHDLGRDSRSEPTVADGTVYVGHQGDQVEAIDTETGDQEWSFDTSAVWGGPTVAGDTVFVGAGPKFSSSGSGFFHALDADSGDERWSFELDARVDSSPTVVDGVVYFGCDDNRVYALDAGVEASSEGSRTRLQTLGHHDQFRQETDETESEDGGSSDGLGPGFGVGGAVAALGGAGYLLRRRLVAGRNGRRLRRG
jgi:PGF-CTERM protein